MKHLMFQPEPLYEQVHKALLSRIQSGEWEPEQPLPGEALLSRELGVSVGTVRRAMDQLTRENIVFRERGRGTFVKVDAEWRSGGGFKIANLSGATTQPNIVLVDAVTTAATPEEAQALKLSKATRFARRVHRLRRDWFVDDDLVCHERIVVEEARFPRLLDRVEATDETLFRYYQESYRTRVETIEWQIQFASGSDSAERFDEKSGKPRRATLLRILRTALNLRGQPLEFCEQIVSLADRSIRICR